MRYCGLVVEVNRLDDCGHRAHGPGDQLRHPADPALASQVAGLLPVRLEARRRRVVLGPAEFSFPLQIY